MNVKKKVNKLSNIEYSFLDSFKELLIMIMGFLVAISYFSNDNDKLDWIIKNIKEKYNISRGHDGNKVYVNKVDGNKSFNSFTDISNIRNDVKLLFYGFINNIFNFEAGSDTRILIFYFILMLIVNSFYYITAPIFKTKNSFNEIILSLSIKAGGIILLPLILFSLFLYIIIIFQTILFILKNSNVDASFSYISYFFLLIYLFWGYLLYYYVDNFIGDLSVYSIENTNIIAIISLIGIILIDYLMFYTDAVSFICSSLTFMNYSVYNYFINNLKDIGNKGSLFTFTNILTVYIILYLGNLLYKKHNLFYIPLLLFLISIFILVYPMIKNNVNMIGQNNNGEKGINKLF